MKMLQGRLVAAPDTPIGTSLAEDAVAGSGALSVLDTYPFDVAGGLLQIGDQAVGYSGIDDDNALIYLDEPTELDAFEGDSVIRLPLVMEKKAIIRVATDSGSKPITVSVPFYMRPLVDEAIRDVTDEPYASLRSFDGENWELADILGLERRVAAEDLTGTLSPEIQAQIPEAFYPEAPSAAPAIDVDPFGVGGIKVTWPVVQYGQEYEVAASFDTPVPEDGSASFAPVTGNTHIFTSLDGVRLPTGEDARVVHVKVRALNPEGAGPWSDEASATPRRADAEELNVEQLNAFTAEIVQAYIANLTTDIVTTSGRIIIGDQQASHIVFDPAVGATFFAPDGQTVLFKLDMTDAQLSEFTGRINASQLSVLNGLELRGLLSRMTSESRLTLSSAVDDPSTPPSLSTGLMTHPWLAPPANYVEYGMSYAGSGTWRQLLWRADTNRCVVRLVGADGIQIGSTVELTNNLPGGVRVAVPSGLFVGTFIYTLRRVIDSAAIGSRGWVLVKYNASTGAHVDSVAIGFESAPAGVVGGYPSLGYNGTHLIVGHMDVTFASSRRAANTAGFDRYVPADLSYHSSAWVDGPIGDGLNARGCNITDLPEFGGVRFWIANAYKVFVFEIDGTELVKAPGVVPPDWSMQPRVELTPSITVGHDGENFYATTGSSQLTRYSSYRAASEADRNFWVQYAWESGTSATAPSPVEHAVLPDHRFLTIGVASPTSGTTTARVFTGTGTTQPANSQMYSRGTLAAGSLRISSTVTSGENPRTESDFSGGTPAVIRSETGGLEFRGDGSMDAPMKMQAGYVAFASGTGALTVSVTFPTPFATAPHPSALPDHINLQAPSLASVSTTGMSVRCDRTGAGTYGIHWNAIVA